ncbi:MAG TPA: alpha/beta hydrolase [Gemmatimonadaceae bacterium]|nr:alpha/beta hydrolase [Gemmatimonadaceae bacterium]
MIIIPPKVTRRGRDGRRRTPPKTAPLVALTVAIAAVFLGKASAFEHDDWMLPVIALSLLVVVAAGMLFARISAEASGEGSGDAAAPDAAEADEGPSGQVRPVTVAIVVGLALAGIVLALVARPARAGAQAAPRQYAYAFMKGADTLIVERVTIDGTHISGEIAQRGAPRIAYVADVADSADGVNVPLLTFRVYGAGASADALPLQTGSMRIGGDSAVVEATTGTAPPQRVATAMTDRPLPLINGSIALMNLMIARAKRAGANAFDGTYLLLAGSGLRLGAHVQFVGTDSAIVTVGSQVHRFAVDASGLITGGTLPSQSLVITRLTGAAAAGVSLGRPDYGAPAGAPYTAEEVTVPTRDGHTLSGTLTIPRNTGGPVPAVVTITGSGQEDRDEFLPLVPNYRPFRQLADTLGRRGIAVLRLDDRGVNASGGDVGTATSADFADDIRAGVAFLRARRDIDPGRIALFGHSEGGLIGPMVAATDPKIAALVIFAGPAYTGRRIIDFQLRNMVTGNAAIPPAQKDSVLKAQVAAFDSAAARSPWTKFFLTYDPLPTLRKVRAPVMILQGGTDQQVTPDQAPIIERTLKDAGNRDVTLRVLPNHNHLFLVDSVGFPGDYAKLKDGRIGPEVMGPLADWLALKLAAPPKP